MRRKDEEERQGEARRSDDGLRQYSLNGCGNLFLIREISPTNGPRGWCEWIPHFALAPGDALVVGPWHPTAVMCADGRSGTRKTLAFVITITTHSKLIF